MKTRLLVLIGLLGLLVLVATSDVAHEATSELVRRGGTVIERYPVLGPIAFVGLSGAAAIVAFFSTVPLLPVAVYAWGEWTTFFLLWGGWMLGGLVSYGIGRGLGPRLVRWFVHPERLAGYETRLRGRMGFGSILIFQLALPSEIPGYLLGTLRYPLRVYAAALALAELPYAWSSVFLSGSFLQRDYTVLILIGVGLVTLSALALRALRRTFGDTA